MSEGRVYNFSPGPSALPLSVLQQAADEMINYRGTGMSVMEMSHRSKMYQDIFDTVKADLKRILNIPDTHEILFTPGGATMQFSAIPMNLIGKTGKADYAITGNFAENAAKEAKKYGEINIAASSADKNHTYIPTQAELKLSSDASYFYYCANNTIFGTEWKYVPETGSVPLVCDMSSNIMSKPIDISKYGIVYAGVQKNMAPAGLAVVIVDKALIGNEMPFTPNLLSYKTMVSKDSMLNTPPCYNIYMLGLMLKWVDSQGGLTAMEELKTARAKVIYDYLDESKLFICPTRKEDRSDMNIPFRTESDELNAEFVKEASSRGLVNLKGHRLVGGMRASVYNAMPIEGAQALVDFMKEFEIKNK